jgi:Arc/MetJ-type ribon-helix-helix transcriptional regulator
MRQINVNVTREFERDLRLLMEQRRLANKSEAIRTAVREAAERDSSAARFDFRSLLGMGLRSPLRRRRPLTEDDLWS